ncbi:hypothetical protein Tco_0246175 [Tanacetum coccineum]
MPFCGCDCADTMADVNVNAPAEQAPAMAPPTRTDEQILPRSRWVPVGKSNCYLDVERSQSNPIYKILVYIMKHTNFFRAFIASSTIPSIYIQQFWDIVRYDKTTGSYSCQLNEKWFTKLIIHHLQSKHKFHPRPGSPLHLPNEEPVLGYLKFSAKGTKREVFRMPIPNNLITADIQGEQYYNSYLEKVAKHHRYLAGEEVSDPDSPAPKPAKATKPKATKQSKPLAPKAAPVTKPAAAKAPKTTVPSLAKRPKAGKVIKKRTQKSSLQLVDEFVDEGVPVNESRFGDEEADLKKAVEESLKDVHAAHQGPLPPVVIREPESGKFQPLSETPKKKSPADQYIFQRRSSVPTEPSGHDEYSSLYAKLGMTDSETESDEEVPGIEAGDQEKGQAGPNPGIQDEGQAGSNPGDAAVSQPQPSHVVHVGPNLEHMDVEVTNSSIQQNPEQMDEELTTTAYPNVQENLKLPTDDQFLEEKSPEDEPEKTNTESEVQSMVTVPIHQDTSSVPLMTTLVIDLTVSQPVSTTIQAPLPTSTATVSKAVDEIVTDAVDWAIQALRKDRFRDLPEVDIKEILHHRMWETKSYESHEDHKKLKKKRRHKSPKIPPGSPPHQPPPPPPPAGLTGTSGASGASESSQLPPPPLPLSTNQSDQSKSTAGSSSSKTSTSAEYTDWTNTNTRLKPFVLLIPEDLHMDADLAPDEQVHSSDDEDIGNDHIPKVNLKQDWWKPLSKEDKPATPEPAWSIPSSDLPILMNNWASAFASTYAPPLENSLLAHTSDMAIFMDWFCKNQGIMELTQTDLEGPAFEIYLGSGSKGGRPALSISKMKAAYYPDVGLEQMVPHQMWIEEECKYDIAAIAIRTHMRILSVVRIEVFFLSGYDYMKTIVLCRADLNEYIIAERDFKYLYSSDFEDLYLLNLQGHLNHLPPQDKKILSTAVNLWIRNLVIRQRVEDFQLGIERYQTQLNLTKPRWDATGFEFKHDFTVIDSPKAVTFRDKYGVQMIMHFNEIHKFSNSTLQQIDEVLDYRVKEFKVNRMNPGLNTWFWTRKDVERRKEFMFAIQKWLKTRRIFYNLENFVGGRVREGDYRLLQRTE